MNTADRKTGLNMSVIGVGTRQFDGEWGKSFTQVEVDRILATARKGDQPDRHG